MSAEPPGPDPGPTPGAGADDGGSEHDETGLDLARSIARALAGSAGRRRAGFPGRPAGPGRRSGWRNTDAQVSGARPDERDPQLLDATIGRLIDDQGWGTDVRVHAVFSRWGSIVGRDVAAHCRPEAFAEGKLVVRTDSTAWATQVRLLAATVVRRLNEELGEGTVRVVDVRGPQAPSWKRGLRSVRDGRGPRDTYG